MGSRSMNIIGVITALAIVATSIFCIVYPNEAAEMVEPVEFGTINDKPLIIVNEKPSVATVGSVIQAVVVDFEPCIEPEQKEESTATDGWMSGQASAYNVQSNGGTSTASGVTLDNESLTVAVPISQSELLGTDVLIKYGNMEITATITDTGGFESLGRALDLSPGVCKAFGFDTTDDCEVWGIQEVKYIFLGEK